MIKVMDIIDEVERVCDVEVEYDSKVVTKLLEYKDYYLVRKPDGLNFTNDFELTLCLQKKEVYNETQKI